MTRNDAGKAQEAGTGVKPARSALGANDLNPPSTRGREEIARIIDLAAFREMPTYRDEDVREWGLRRPAREEAYRKADAILALGSHLVGGGGGRHLAQEGLPARETHPSALTEPSAATEEVSAFVLEHCAIRLRARIDGVREQGGENVGMGLALAETVEGACREGASHIARLSAAIEWALGKGDDFTARPDGAGAYWWRRELGVRAGHYPATPKAESSETPTGASRAEGEQASPDTHPDTLSEGCGRLSAVQMTGYAATRLREAEGIVYKLCEQAIGPVRQKLRHAWAIVSNVADDLGKWSATTTPDVCTGEAPKGGGE